MVGDYAKLWPVFGLKDLDFCIQFMTRIFYVEFRPPYVVIETGITRIFIYKKLETVSSSRSFLNFDPSVVTKVS